MRSFYFVVCRTTIPNHIWTSHHTISSQLRLNIILWSEFLFHKQTKTSVNGEKIYHSNFLSMTTAVATSFPHPVFHLPPGLVHTGGLQRARLLRPSCAVQSSPGRCGELEGAESGGARPAGGGNCRLNWSNKQRSSARPVSGGCSPTPHNSRDHSEKNLIFS